MASLGGIISLKKDKLVITSVIIEMVDHRVTCRDIRTLSIAMGPKELYTRKQSSMSEIHDARRGP
jgi:hypothetical protein